MNAKDELGLDGWIAVVANSGQERLLLRLRLFERRLLVQY